MIGLSMESVLWYRIVGKNSKYAAGVDYADVDYSGDWFRIQADLRRLA